MEDKYSINQIEILSGIKSHTLRIWEKRYQIIVPKRTETNFRYYDGEDLKKVLNIAFLNQNGYKISKIASLPEDVLQKEVYNVHKNSNGNIDANLLLTQALIAFDLDSFEEIFNEYRSNHSFENTITDLVVPFFERIGILWQTNKICPAQEHLFSQFFKQKLMSEIESTPLKKEKTRVLLFLRENEFHELGLLVYHYILRKRGYEVFNLGASVPLESIEKAVKSIKPKLIISSFISYLDKDGFNQYFKDLKNTIGDNYKYMFSGNTDLLNECNKKQSYHVINNLASFIKLLD